MKGIILAGGTGSRLFPVTRAVSKQLIPIYDKPMIYYPLSVLMLAGIKDILVITTPGDKEAFRGLLGDGSQWGLNISQTTQNSPDGLAQAFLLGKEFIGGQPCSLVLGDNIFFGHGLQGELQMASQLKSGARIFGYHTSTPEQYGVAEFDQSGTVISIEEKPKNPKSNYAVTGLYFYDHRVTEFAENLKPSARGELEITDLNMCYLRDGSLSCVQLGRGTAWLDTGSPDGMLQASQFVQTVQERQGLRIACPEEIAFQSGWIDEAGLLKNIQDLGKTDYAVYLRRLLDDGTPRNRS
jgi:glucose-1-phosphate thymidylyltransferase